MTYLKYIDENGRPVVAQLGEGVTPKIAAEVLGLAPGKYKIITEEEAEAIRNSFEIEENKS